VPQQRDGAEQYGRRPKQDPPEQRCLHTEKVTEIPSIWSAFAKSAVSRSLRLKSASGGLRLWSRQVNHGTRALELGSHPHQVSKGVGFHFLHNLSTMCLHCDLTDAERSADLFI